MVRNKSAFILLLAVLLPAAGWAQAPIPGPLSGNREYPHFSQEMEPTNTLTMNMGVSAHFDDNALNDNQDKVSNFLYEFMPGVAWDISRAHWRFSADSVTPISYSYNLPQYGNFSENLLVALEYKPTARLDFRVRDSFTRSADPFLQSQFGVGPGIGNPAQPNPALLGPPAERLMELVGADVTYAVGAHTNIGANGMFSLLNYNSLVGASPLTQPDTYTTTGQAFVSHQFSPRTTSSLAYQVQRFTFSNSFGALSHSITYYHTLTLNPTMSFSVWAGPQYLSSSTGIVPASGFWSWTGGAAYSWTRNRTGITASVLRQVSDGGGLGYVVEMTGANVGIRRQIQKRWVASAFVNYYINSSVASFGNFNSRYFSGSAGVTRTLSRNLTLSLEYWRDRQGLPSAGGIVSSSDHNRAAVTLHYRFSRPLGS